jgi:lipoprotein-anchoring transpeptidase ErfK/SrfK
MLTLMSSRTQLKRDRLRRGGSAVAVALFAAGACCVLVAPARAAGSRVAANQPLVVLLDDHVARTWPNARAHRVESVDARRPLTGVRTVLPLLGHALSRSGQSWLHVRLPGRPNGHKGWIRANQTRRTSTAWNILLELSTRRLTVYHHGRAADRFRAVVGKPSTPTPRGRFFIEEALAVSSQDAGGPFALATSARSHVLHEFEGGPGQIALHGTNNLSGALGSAASHGCVRLSTRAITWLAERIGGGVPLTIRR